MQNPGTFLCVGFHCRCVVCACSAGAVGSFSNKPLSPKLPKLHQKDAPRSASRVADSVSDGDGCVPGSEWPCRLRAASVASHQCPGRPLALRCSRGLPTDKMRIEALMKSSSSHRLELPITTRFLTKRSHKRCPTMAPRHVRQHRCSSGMQAKMQARVSLPYEE